MDHEDDALNYLDQALDGGGGRESTSGNSPQQGHSNKAFESDPIYARPKKARSVPMGTNNNNNKETAQNGGLSPTVESTVKSQLSDSGSAEARSDVGMRRGSSSLSIANLPVQTKPASLSRRVIASSVSQNFTEQAKKSAANFSSMNYMPSHSITYMDWLKEYSPFLKHVEWDRWFLTFCIGVGAALVAVFHDQCISALNTVKWTDTRAYMDEDNLWKSWGWTVGYTVAMVIGSSVLVAFVHPPAAGGGTPEVIAYLNGVIVHNVFGLKNLLVKFTSNVLAMVAGLAAGTQGPIIAFGAIVGRGLGQFRSDTLSCTPKIFNRFRNAIDRRSFTTCGVAAGVAAGFNAPIGGLMFAMEDLSSFWSKELSQQVFFASVTATAVSGLFKAAFNGFKFGGLFGLFTIKLVEPIQLHIAQLCASIVMGVVGALIGVIFTLVNVRVVGKARKLVLSKMTNPTCFKFGRVFETILLAVVMGFYYTVFPASFDCTNLADVNVNLTGLSPGCIPDDEITVGNISIPTSINLIPYNCHAENLAAEPGNYYYNEMATIIQNGGQGQLNVLWSRDTHYFFSWSTPLLLFAFYYPVAIWTLGSCIAGGIFVPVLLSGAFMGRALGIGMLYLYQHLSGIDIPTSPWAWIDPGLISVLGSGAMLGGVTRLALASTIIVVEMSQDINMVVPVMIAVLVAKNLADLMSKPLYKFQLDAKTLPYLDHEPRVAFKDEILNLELFRAADVMASPVRTIRAVESLYSLSEILTRTRHEGFPVIKRDFESGLDVCYGMITRTELYGILYSDELYSQKTSGSVIVPDVDYHDISLDYIKDSEAKHERAKHFGQFDDYKSVYVNLDSFINISVPKVDRDYSLLRTYQLFRTLGLRHLLVTDIRNQVVGMITRQDLMPFNIQDKLSSIPARNAEMINVKDTGSESSESEIYLVGSKPDMSVAHPAVTSVRAPVTHRSVSELIREEGSDDARSRDSGETSGRDSARTDASTALNRFDHRMENGTSSTSSSRNTTTQL